MLATIERELDKLAARIEPDVLAVTDPAGNVLAVAGRRKPTGRCTRWSGRAWTARATPTSPSGRLPVRLGAARAAGHRDRHAAARQGARRPLRAGAVGALRRGDAHHRQAGAGGGDARAGGGRSRSPGRSLRGSARDGAVDRQRRPSTRSSCSSSAATPRSTRSTRSRRRRACRCSRRCARCSGSRSARALFAAVAQRLAGANDLAADRHAVASLSHMTTSRDFEHPVPPTGFSSRVDALTDSLQHDDAVGHARRSGDAQRLRRRDPGAGAGARRAGSVHGRPLGARQRAVGRGRPADAAGRGQLEVLRLGALLHDIGKIGISDAVLRKPGPLTQEEFELIQEHPARRRAHPAQRAVPGAAPPDRRAAPRAARRPGLSVPACAATKSRCSRASSTSPTRSTR